MFMRLAIAFLALVLQQALATGSIEGIVVRSDNGEPIANAQVTLQNLPNAQAPGGVVVAAAPITATATAGFAGEFGGVSNVPANARINPTTTTGPDGKFLFKDLNAGNYRVAATANGFVRAEYGQRALNGQGRPLVLTAGQPVKDAAIRLTPTGTISGRVFDENGQPATGAPVQLLRVVYNNQQVKGYQAAGNGSADDRGDYRIYGVTPGRYYLLAGTTQGPLSFSTARGGGSARFEMLYYPNATEPDQASTIDVKSGAESSFDFRLKRQTQTFHVRGRVVDPSGAPLPANLNVMLAYRSVNGGSGSFSTGRSFDPTTNTFDLANVTPGDYNVTVQIPVQAAAVSRAGVINAADLVARQTEQATRPSASFPIKLVNADIDGVVLTLTTGVTVPGRLVVEGQPISAVPNLDRLRLAFQNSNPVLTVPLPVAQPIAADGTFQVVGLREGEYRVQLGVPGFYLKSIKYGTDDILGKPFKFSGGGSAAFEITLRAGSVTATGTVSDAKSQPVPGTQVVFVPAQRSRFDLMRSGVTDQSGKFTIANLAPGEYKVFSWESVDINAFFDPEFLKQYEQQGKAVTLAEGSSPIVDVKVIPAQ
jgi:hypothetical protein